jgi:hypothetical protein
MVYASKSEYRGEWSADRLHGRGVMRYADGNYYDGEWMLSQYHGNGVYTWHHGGVISFTYEGVFVRGKAHGPGTLTNRLAGRVDRGVAKEGCIMMGQQWFTIGANMGSCQR